MIDQSHFDIYTKHRATQYNENLRYFESILTSLICFVQWWKINSTKYDYIQLKQRKRAYKNELSKSRTWREHLKCNKRKNYCIYINNIFTILFKAFSFVFLYFWLSLLKSFMKSSRRNTGNNKIFHSLFPCSTFILYM